MIHKITSDTRKIHRFGDRTSTKFVIEDMNKNNKFTGEKSTKWSLMKGQGYYAVAALDNDGFIVYCEQF